MFHGAVRDDIAYEFITGLPNRYHTVIGQHGHGLSGGQRQRIAIAGAMVTQAPVLVLDEPTASLDAASVDRLLGPLRRLATGRTAILITHDARLTAIADRTLVLTDGHIEVDHGMGWTLKLTGHL